VDESADRKFLCHDGKQWTFGEVDERMRRLATGLRELGVGLGTRVAVGMENSAKTFMVHAALRELGAVMIPVMPGLTAAEVSYQLNHSRPELTIAGESIGSALAAVVEHEPDLCRLLVDDGSDGDGPRGVASLDELLERSPLDPGERLAGYDDRSPSLILYTSGSTGRPKGVVLPAGALPSAGIGYADRFAISADDTFFLCMPMSHGVGALVAPGMALGSGCRLAIEQRFRPSRFWGAVERVGGTVSILFPAQLNLLLETEGQAPAANTSTLRLAITHAWLPAFHERFGTELGLCWGMTETGGTSTGTDSSHRGEGGPGYVGEAMDGVELAIMDEAARPLPPNVEGEICLRHAHCMLEYLDDAETTGQTVVDGWVHSGDRGHLDERGGLHFAGRIKNMIKRSGENVSPEELQSVLEQCETVSESLVFGVPDPIRTEEVAAVVVARPGHELDVDELAAFASARLARWKRPRYVAVAEAPLPRLTNGKIDREAVLAGFRRESCWDSQVAS
jgi:crotonobetaine/carnitine-CoA ligase